VVDLKISCKARHFEGGSKLISLLCLVRYRFFLFAGMLPYLLGQAISYNIRASLNWNYFWWGFAGIFLVLVAVELFNEYFDSKYGGDRIFSRQEHEIPNYFFACGILALGLAFIVGLYLALQTGWAVLLFCFFGFLGAYFYVGWPVKWAYRGMGELVIALCYGPLMILGSYYIQTEKVAFMPFFASLLGGLSMFCLAILNEIPDYYQDKVVGKQNLVVRLGKQKAIVLLELCLAVLFILLISGMIAKTVPLSGIAAVATLPWILKSVRSVEKDYDNPKVFLFAINTIVVSHVLLIFSLGIGFLKGHVR
jgi:1,4-dihydroxy-2-naphthoate octaprenyltransferase